METFSQEDNDVQFSSVRLLKYYLSNWEYVNESILFFKHLEKNLSLETCIDLFPEKQWNKIVNWRDPNIKYNYFWECFLENQKNVVYFLEKIKSVKDCWKKLIKWSKLDLNESFSTMFVFFLYFQREYGHFSKLEKEKMLNVGYISEELKKMINYGYFTFFQALEF